MIGLYAMGLNFRQERPSRQIEMRYINVLILLSFAYDIGWMVIFTEVRFL